MPLSRKLSKVHPEGFEPVADRRNHCESSPNSPSAETNSLCRRECRTVFTLPPSRVENGPRVGHFVLHLIDNRDLLNGNRMAL